MRYDITNIPVAEGFEEGDGCPICRLRNTLEKRAVEYITGAAMMEPEDVILFFSYSGSTRDVMETVKLAKERQGKVILVTRFANSPAAELSDLVLQCGANENPLQSGSIAARIAQMYLMDVLFSEYSRRNLVRTRYNRARIAEALADKHL